MKYSLVTLLKVRQHHKVDAERTLFEAQSKLESEEKKFAQIQQHLEKTIQGRALLQDNFFNRAQGHPMNQQEALLLAALSQKTVSSEYALKRSLSQQANVVSDAKQRKTAATSSAIEAHRELKIIKKHHALWQRQVHKHEELKNEYENDDQNGVRFWLGNKRG